MRCRLILLISEHPIQQGIRKGGGPHFCDEERRGQNAYSISWIRPVYLQNVHAMMDLSKDFFVPPLFCGV